MSDLAITCVDARADRYAAAPTLLFRLRITESTGVRVHAIALRCQIRIEPARRRYAAGEAERLLELFGETPQWGESLKPMQFAAVGVVVPSFTGATEIDVPVPCTYDFEVGAAKYVHALSGGEIPMLVLFSGTIFRRTDDGRFEVQQVPWSLESRLRVPVGVWRELMDRFFPGEGWIRLRRDTLDAVARFKARRALPTWEDAFAVLLEQAGEGDA
ncbi:MAG TPA: DUF6084 family protein [Pseudonocardia sp.]|jgi:hypothetical protein|uniref:DUF6084 family protein n=1 Tax=Pseudonocardia sp. TaxID=60912 RepID=UPI002B4B8786|nr:DUF6084 family protein [Pseudonocardia sp.]HLU57741.1 DUF6084 family protein [Pseudonocardia sp.]